MENNKLMYSMDESEERNWSIFSHLGIFVGMIIPFGSLLTPFLIWQVNKDKSDFITDHAIEALNFQITMMIVYVVCLILCFIIIGIPMLFVAVVVDVVYSIKGAIRAGKGEYYDYPFNLRLIK